jgi:hypothetical protein
MVHQAISNTNLLWKERAMKVFVKLCLVLLLVVFSGNAFAWEGRMAGMGDPTGLVADESDLLIHPAKTANGEGVRVYNFYRFNYKNISEWSWHSELDGGLLTTLIPLGLSASWDYDNDGTEYVHQGLAGTTFPLGPGRMGLFFQYEGTFSDYEGDEMLELGGLGGSLTLEMDNQMEQDLNDFAFRLIYGFPVGSVNLAVEAKVGYKDEESSYNAVLEDLSVSGAGSFPGTFEVSNFPFWGLNKFVYPYDSEYWDMAFKLGIQWAIGQVQFDLTPRFGFIFAGDNSLDSNMDLSLPGGINMSNDIDLDGDVDGWNWGTDFWMRFPLTEDVSMPWLFRIAQSEKERTTSGSGSFDISLVGVSTLLDWDYDIEEDTFEIVAGTGLDINMTSRAKLAIGVYYNYINTETRLETVMSIPGLGGGADIIFDQEPFPETTEHRIDAKLGWEYKLGRGSGLRAGLGFFYGFVEEEYNLDIGADILGVSLPSLAGQEVTLDGDNIGFSGSLGATIKTGSLTFEPFVNGGYRKLSLDGDNDWLLLSLPILTFDTDLERSEWYICGGLSLLFDF